jgi:AcrR family transcriptional regulator
MAAKVERPYDNSRRQGQVRATRAHVAAVAKERLVEHGYPTTTIEAIADAADVPLPTLYRLFGSKRGLLSAVLDTSFGGDDEPIAFGDRPEVQAALAEPDVGRMLDAFARICRKLMDRASTIQRVLATAAIVDPELAELDADIRRQRHTGQSRIVAAIVARGALSPSYDEATAADVVYALLSPEVHWILTSERRWGGEDYERWLSLSFRELLRPESRSPRRTPGIRRAPARSTAVRTDSV